MFAVRISFPCEFYNRELTCLNKFFEILQSTVLAALSRYSSKIFTHQAIPDISYTQSIKIKVSLDFLGHKSSIDSKTFLIKRVEVTKG